MNQQPLVSVIISTYNRSQFVGQAINTVFNQTYQKFELIVVDDCSLDSTPTVVREFTDKRLHYVRHEINKGGPAARNTGIRLAKGEFIAFLDDDDLWLPNKLDHQMTKMIQAPVNVGVIYTGSVTFSSNGKIIRRDKPREKGNLYNRLLRGSTIGSVSKVLIKNECFDKAGLFDEQLKSCQDWDMWLRISEHYDFDYVNKPLVKIRQHPEQISTDFGCFIPGRITMVEKHYDKFAETPSILIQHLKKIGKLLCLNGSWKEGWCWFLKVIRLNPIEIFKIMLWLLLEMPIRKMKTRTFKTKQG